jgi:two-component system, OmpR family, response regulator
MARQVILLEDETEIRSLLTNILEREGFSVASAGSLAEFDALAERERADLYLIDLELPDGSGISVLRRVAQRRAAGIIVLTARAEEIDQVIGLELGADDFVTKPFRRRELVARINAVLRRVMPAQSPDVTLGEAERSAAGDLEFDGYRLRLSSRQIFTPNGAEATLTTAEFDLLVALLKRRGQALSREQLITLMKGQDWAVHDRVVDGLVSRLRRKLPPVEGRTTPYIRTIHGVGYAFAD